MKPIDRLIYRKQNGSGQRSSQTNRDIIASRAALEFKDGMYGSLILLKFKI